MFEEQKLVLEQRFRSLLQDAIQDAVFLATTNSELQQQNEQLCEGLSVYIYVSVHMPYIFFNSYLVVVLICMCDIISCLSVLLSDSLL